MNLYDVYTLYNLELTHASGAHVYNSQGVGYLDFYGGHAVISIGHCHPYFNKMVSDQLHKMPFYSNSVINRLQQTLADKLERISGAQGYDLFLINSGAEANENALKLASFYNQRTKVIALNNSFHGRTSAAINVTHTGKKYTAPINHGVEVEYHSKDDADAMVRSINTKEVSAVIVEAIQGVGGLDAMTKEVAQKIRLACDETDTLLIFDEVQCGYGRSGRFFAFQYLDVRPDLITTAKGMGNGIPIGGVLIDTQKMPAVNNRLGTTFGGNHLACAAGIAVLDVIDAEGLVENASKMGKILADELTSIKGITEVKGKGLMMGAAFDRPIAPLRDHLVYEQHLFTGSSSNAHLMRILPPLHITEKDIEVFLTKLKRGIESVF